MIVKKMRKNAKELNVQLCDGYELDEEILVNYTEKGKQVKGGSRSVFFRGGGTFFRGAVFFPPPPPSKSATEASNDIGFGGSSELGRK